MGNMCQLAPRLTRLHATAQLVQCMSDVAETSSLIGNLSQLFSFICGIVLSMTCAVLTFECCGFY